MEAFDSEGYEPSWFHELINPAQFSKILKYQWRATIRLVLFFLVVLLPLIPGYLLNALVFKDGLDLVWVLMSALPGAVAVLAVLAMAGLFVKKVFKLKSWRAGFRYALLCLFGRPLLLKYPFAIIGEGEVRSSDREKSVANRELGGPGRLIINNDSAVALERYGRITRIVGPGAVFLERFERIRRIIDLRPQTRTQAALVYTKDGIALTADITVHFQIQCGQPTLEKPYPALPEALAKAVHADACKFFQGQIIPMDWRDRVMGNVESTLREIVAPKTLDEVFEPTNAAKDPRDDIGREILVQLRQKSEAFGVDMHDVSLGPFRPAHEAVIEQRRASWQVGHAANVAVEQTRGEAQAMLARETAYAYAQLEMMLAIDRGFQKLDAQNRRLPASFIAIRFIETLRRIAIESGIAPYLPYDVTETLAFLNKQLLGGGSPGGGGGTGPGGGSRPPVVGSVGPDPAAKGGA